MHTNTDKMDTAQYQQWHFSNKHRATGQQIPPFPYGNANEKAPVSLSTFHCTQLQTPDTALATRTSDHPTPVTNLQTKERNCKNHEHPYSQTKHYDIPDHSISP